MDAPAFPSFAALCVAALSFSAVDAGAARAQVTEVVVNPAAPGTAYEARYSQALTLEARLTANGVPVDGSAFSNPDVRIVFTIAPLDAPDDAFVLADPVVDAAGYARARLALVDGYYGGVQFHGDGTTTATAFPYVITAEFTGRNSPPLGDCQATDGGAPADAGEALGLCAATGTGPLLVTWELPTLEMDPVDEEPLGATVTLIATLLDPTGDAPLAGAPSEVNGPGPKPIEGGTVSFFYDVDGNGQPSLDERLGTSLTSAEGIATFDFLLDPQFVNAGDFEAGIHVQYAGDQRRYTIAGDASRLSVLAGEPDPTRSLIESDPPTMAADGFSTVKITVTLVDPAGNVLDVNAPDFDVTLQTDLGTLQESVERDPITGAYVQELKAGRAGGTAHVTATIEGAPGPTVEVKIVKEGCACVETSGGTPLALFGFLAPLLLPARRRR